MKFSIEVVISTGYATNSSLASGMFLSGFSGLIIAFKIKFRK